MRHRECTSRTSVVYLLFVESSHASHHNKISSCALSKGAGLDDSNNYAYSASELHENHNRLVAAVVAVGGRSSNRNNRNAHAAHSTATATMPMSLKGDCGSGDVCRMISLCRAVRENRCETRYVTLDDPKIRVFCDERAFCMGRALGHNTVVRHLQIPVTHLTPTSCGTQALAKVLQSNPKLVHVEIAERMEDFLAKNPSRNPLKEYRRILAVVDCFLGALSLNQGDALRSLKMPRIFGPLALVSCLASLRHSLTKICWELPHSEVNSQETTTDDAILLGATMASLPALKTLRVDCSTRNWDFLIPFLRGLTQESSTSSLRSLLLWNLPQLNENEPVVIAIHDALRALPNLQGFHLHVQTVTVFTHNPDQSGGVTHILRGLQHHPRRLRFLQLAGNGIVSEPVAPQVVHLLEHNDNYDGGIHGLCLDCDRLEDVCTVMAALETNTTLKKLRVVVQNQEVDDPVAFAGACERLGVLLPRVAVLKELELVLKGGCPISGDLLRGFCGNRSLTRIQIRSRSVNDDNNISDARIHYYGMRNYWRSRLAGVSLRELPTVLKNLWKLPTQGQQQSIAALLASSPTNQSCLSLTFETLRTRDDWFDREARGRPCLLQFKDGELHCGEH